MLSMLLVSRAENSMTHRHMTEFTGLDFEMTIHEHYFEVLDVIERLFTYMFDGLHKRWGKLSLTTTIQAKYLEQSHVCQCHLLFVCEADGRKTTPHMAE